MRILTWNMRGLRDKSRRASLLRYLREWGIDYALIQETHIEGRSDRLWSDLLASGMNDFMQIDAQGRSGGIAIWWRWGWAQCLEVHKARHLLTCKFQIHQG
jgi:exonuclease III